MKVAADPIKEMLERTRRMPRLIFLRPKSKRLDRISSDVHDAEDFYFLYLPSLFIIAEENPSIWFANHDLISFSAKQAVGQVDLTGRLKALSCIRKKSGASEMRFELESGLHLQYGATGIGCAVSGQITLQLYSAAV